MNYKRFILISGAIITTLLLLSSATAINNILNTKQIERITNNIIKKHDIVNEKIDEEGLLIKTIAKILNDNKLREDLKVISLTKKPKYKNFLSYDCNDINNLYYRGLKIYNSLSENQLKQKKEQIINLINMNYNFFVNILKSIEENKVLMNNIKELSKNSICDECKKDYIGWYPGIIICSTLFIITLAFIPIALIGFILSEFGFIDIGTLLIFPALLTSALASIFCLPPPHIF